MKITIEINDCSDCRHLGHSGAFTIGGARPVCGHYGVCRPENVGRPDPDQMDICHWAHRVPFTDMKNPVIPDWCPLKHGGKY